MADKTQVFSEVTEVASGLAKAESMILLEFSGLALYSCELSGGYLFVGSP